MNFKRNGAFLSQRIIGFFSHLFLVSHSKLTMSEATRSRDMDMDMDMDRVLDLSSTKSTCINCNTHFVSSCPATLDSALPLGTFPSADNWTTYAQALSIVFQLPPLDLSEDETCALCDSCAGNLATIVHLYQKTFCVGPQVARSNSSSMPMHTWFSTLQNRGSLLVGEESAGTGDMKSRSSRDIKPNIELLAASVVSVVYNTGPAAELQLQKLKEQALSRQCHVKIQPCDTEDWQTLEHKPYKIDMDQSDVGSDNDCPEPYESDQPKPRRRLRPATAPKRKRVRHSVQEKPRPAPKPKRKRVRNRPRRPKQYKCPHADAEGSGGCTWAGSMSILEFHSHLATEHQEPERRVCRFCQFICPNLKELRVHIQSHRNEKYMVKGVELPVPTCNIQPCTGRVFYTTSRLKLHQGYVHAEGNLNKLHHTCGTCGKVFKVKANMKTHEKLKHSALPPERPFVCETCGAAFVVSEHLSYHRKYAHIPESLKIPCPVPGCTFKASKPCRLREHSLKHSQQPNFQCDQCPKSYKHEKSLRDHLKSHLNQRSFICWALWNGHECGSRFNRKYHLVQHLVQAHGLAKNEALEISNRPQSKTDQPYESEEQQQHRKRKRKTETETPKSNSSSTGGPSQTESQSYSYSYSY